MKGQKKLVGINLNKQITNTVLNIFNQSIDRDVNNLYVII